MLCGVLLASSLTAMTITAEELVTESRDVSDFHAISIKGSGHVEINRGTREGLELQAPAATVAHIVTEVTGGVLNIYHEKGSWNLRGPIHIEIAYVELDALELSGSADVRADRISGDTFEIDIRGSSDVDVAGFDLTRLTVEVSGSGDLDVQNLSAEVLAVSVRGSGDVTLRGEVESLSVAVRGSGNVATENLVSRRAEATVSGSGDVRLWATESLSATISGSGNISYRGEPEISSRVSGSGRLRAR
jgi:hypothetical protein